MPGLLDKLPICTSRLCLRLFSKRDAEALFEIQRDPLLTRYAGGTRTREQSEASLTRIINRTAPAGFGPLAVEEQESGKVVGWCGVQPLTGTDRYEVIYALKVNRWGMGYATEAAASVVTHAFELPTCNIEAVWALVYPQNLRSIRVLEKLGMELVGNEYREETKQHASVYVVQKAEFERIIGDRGFTPPQSSTDQFQ